MPSWHDSCSCVSRWHRDMTYSHVRGKAWPSLSYVDMTDSHVWHDSLTHDSLTRVSFAASMRSWHDSFLCVWDHPLSHTWTWLILTCDVTHTHMTRSLPRWDRDMTYSHVCRITHSHIRGHDSFSRVTLLNHTFVRCLDDVGTWLILTCDMTHSHMTGSLPQ